MRKLFLFILLSGLIFILPTIAQAKTPSVDLVVTHIFGKQIDIQADFQSDLQIQSIKIMIQANDGDIIAAEALSLSPGGQVRYSLDLVQQPIRAFSALSIWFEIDYKDGSSLTTEATNYLYDDNRFDWQDLHSNEFSVYWYQDDPDLGQAIINVAYEGLERIQNQVDVPSPQGIVIYAYASVVDMQETLMFSGGASYWVAGHADSDLGVIVVSLPPGPEQTMEIKRQIPHELVHVLLHRKMGSGYSNLPRWVNEGLASTAELFPNPDYQLLLDKAYERESLIPIKDLCASFPIDAANFQLSYAESYAFTWYLQQTYGKEKIEKLLQSYGSGLNCESGALAAFDVPLSKLEADWRAAMFNENIILNLWQDNLAWVILFGVVLITPVGLTLIRFSKRGQGQAGKWANEKKMISP